MYNLTSPQSNPNGPSNKPPREGKQINLEVELGASFVFNEIPEESVSEEVPNTLPSEEKPRVSVTPDLQQSDHDAVRTILILCLMYKEHKRSRLSRKVSFRSTNKKRHSAKPTELYLLGNSGRKKKYRGELDSSAGDDLENSSIIPHKSDGELSSSGTPSTSLRSRVTPINNDNMLTTSTSDDDEKKVTKTNHSPRVIFFLCAHYNSKHQFFHKNLKIKLFPSKQMYLLILARGAPRYPQQNPLTWQQ